MYRQRKFLKFEHHDHEGNGLCTLIDLLSIRSVRCWGLGSGVRCWQLFRHHFAFQLLFSLQTTQTNAQSTSDTSERKAVGGVTQVMRSAWNAFLEPTERVWIQLRKQLMNSHHSSLRMARSRFSQFWDSQVSHTILPKWLQLQSQWTSVLLFNSNSWDSSFFTFVVIRSRGRSHFIDCQTYHPDRVCQGIQAARPTEVVLRN